MTAVRGRRSWAAGIAVVVALSGCAAGPELSDPPGRPSAPPLPSVGPGEVTLAGIGLRNGPADRVVLPAGVVVDERIDQANVVTVLVSSPPGAEFVAFLRAELPRAGFEISAASETGVVFSGFGWDGGATAGEPSGLTLRRRQ